MSKRIVVSMTGTSRKISSVSGYCVYKRGVPQSESFSSFDDAEKELDNMLDEITAGDFEEDDLLGFYIDKCDDASMSAEADDEPAPAEETAKRKGRGPARPLAKHEVHAKLHGIHKMKVAAHKKKLKEIKESKPHAKHWIEYHKTQIAHHTAQAKHHKAKYKELTTLPKPAPVPAAAG